MPTAAGSRPPSHLGQQGSWHLELPGGVPPLQPQGPGQGHLTPRHAASEGTRQGEGRAADHACKFNPPGAVEQQSNLIDQISSRAMRATPGGGLCGVGGDSGTCAGLGDALKGAMHRSANGCRLLPLHQQGDHGGIGGGGIPSAIWCSVCATM